MMIMEGIKISLRTQRVHKPKRLTEQLPAEHAEYELSQVSL